MQAVFEAELLGNHKLVPFLREHFRFRAVGPDSEEEAEELDERYRDLYEYPE
jgi:hypothetical protein